VTSTSSTSTTTTTEVPVTTTTQPPKTPESVIIARITDIELAESVESIITGEVTVEVLDELVNNENFDNLDEETLEAVSEALSEAPTEIKEEFESEVNVYNGSFDTYVPVGSRISVEDRRVVVAVTATVSAAAAAPAGGGRRRR